MQSVLVLNATYQPLSVVPAKRAIHLMKADKATALDGSGRFFTSPSESIEIPYVILLKKVVKQGKTREPGFSRRGVLARDNHSCVYCGKPANTIDHVFPRSLGGKDTYDNCVAACVACNSKKANKTLEQMGWALPKKPSKSPTHLTKLLAQARRHEHQFSAWRPYIALYEPSA
jgi:5-methylcytosine-specific restriction endonuclease McrA